MTATAAKVVTVLHCELGAAVSILLILLFKTTLGNTYHCNLHFTAEEIESGEVK